MGNLSDYCQCCAKKLNDEQSYRCSECYFQGYCQERGCGKCRNHCPHMTSGDPAERTDGGSSSASRAWVNKRHG